MVLKTIGSCSAPCKPFVLVLNIVGSLFSSCWIHILLFSVLRSCRLLFIIVCSVPFKIRFSWCGSRPFCNSLCFFVIAYNCLCLFVPMCWSCGSVLCAVVGGWAVHVNEALEDVPVAS